MYLDIYCIFEWLAKKKKHVYTAFFTLSMCYSHHLTSTFALPVHQNPLKSPSCIALKLLYKCKTPRPKMQEMVKKE